ncbi:MAG: hypothetical protein WC496_00645 [Phycisphaerae bacterium]|jgi:hypothetical protein
MFARKKINKIPVQICICKDVLNSIFDECDKNDIDETGGRIIGYYNQNRNKLNINVCGLIASGPNAKSSPTSFFQDGIYQESIFRKLEEEYPNIEHLGNWHTHHVNGLQTLSGGDITTYIRTVNHDNHNTDFFYALLVIAKNNKSFFNKERYLVKHFLLKRGETDVQEIPPAQVKIIKEPALFIDKQANIEDAPIKQTSTLTQSMINHTRAVDKEFISEMYPELKPFLLKQTKSLCWRGEINLIDNSSVEILVLESIDDGVLSYSITLSTSCKSFFSCQQLYLKRKFGSAWKAIYLFERDLNKEIFKKLKKILPF